MYKVGSDMPEGEYVLIGSGSMAYFAIDKDSTGDFDSIVANDIFYKRSIVTIKDGQYLEFTDCTAYAFNDAPKAKLTDGLLPDGMYKVGIDLPAGEYKVIPDGDTPYIEVSTDSTHMMDSIVFNDILQGERYITVTNGQYVKLSNAQLKIQ